MKVDFREVEDEDLYNYFELARETVIRNAIYHVCRMSTTYLIIGIVRSEIGL